MGKALGRRPFALVMDWPSLIFFGGVGCFLIGLLVIIMPELFDDLFGGWGRSEELPEFDWDEYSSIKKKDED